MLRLLVENIIRCYMNGFRHKSTFHKVGNIISIVIFFVLYTLIFLFTSRCFSFLSKINHHNLDLYLLSIFLAGILSYLLLAGISDASYYLFLSPDLSLLLSMPIHPRTLWVYKLLMITFSKSLFLSVGLAGILGYGHALGGSLLYYPAATVLFIIFCFIPVAIGMLFVLLPVRFMNPKKVHSIFRVLSEVMLFITVMIIFIHLYTLDSLQKLQLEKYHKIILSPVWQWLPSGWLANSLYSLVAGRIVPTIAYGLSLMITCYILFHFHCFRKKRSNIFPEPAEIQEGVRPMQSK